MSFIWNSKKNVIILVPVLILVAYYASGFIQGNKERAILRNISAAYSSSSQEIPLQNVIDPDWDRVCAIPINASAPPSLTNEGLRALLSVQELVDVPSILYSKTGHLLPLPTVQFVMFFMKEDKIVSVLKWKRPFVKHGNDYLYLSTQEDAPQCVNRRTAVFALRPSASQFKYFRLKGD